LSEKAEAVLAFAAEGATNPRDEAVVHLRGRLALLRSCRARGIAATFDPTGAELPWSGIENMAPSTDQPAADPAVSLSAELRALADDRGAIGEENLGLLLSRRPELAAELREQLAQGELTWTPAPDRIGVAATIEALAHAQPTGDWARAALVATEALRITSRD